METLRSILITGTEEELASYLESRVKTVSDLINILTQLQTIDAVYYDIKDEKIVGMIIIAPPLRSDIILKGKSIILFMIKYEEKEEGITILNVKKNIVSISEITDKLLS